jgi:hypothetical protein
VYWDEGFVIDTRTGDITYRFPFGSAASAAAVSEAGDCHALGNENGEIAVQEQDRQGEIRLRVKPTPENSAKPGKNRGPPIRLRGFERYVNGYKR